MLVSNSYEAPYGFFQVIPNSAPLEIPKPKQGPIKYLNRHVNNPALMNVYGRKEPRSPSPKNIRPKTKTENSQRSNQGFRFDEKRKRNYIQKKNEQPRNQPKNPPKNQPKNAFFDNNAFEFDSHFQEQVRKEHSLLQKNQTSKSNGIDNILLNNEEPPPTPNPANDTRLNQEMDELNIRRNELSRSVDSTIRATPDSGRFTFSENENEKDHCVQSQHSKNPFAELDKSFVGKKRTDALTKSYWNIHSNTVIPSLKSEMTEEEKEIIRLKSKIGQVSRLVLSLTEDQHISQQMKLLGLEEYEELMKLVTS
ncbi:hypothetical protein CAEBREN_32315 [Caenorhabditis brenneri]|uniref:Uncharacterized protein n=1 Tax=Caenorhabditis brenneri TaxID=135651 RepID=G0NYI2_CAEBE|nr:hypothetical protein CAEBREN_32315 [Caenorhabditis brenneri]